MFWFKIHTVHSPCPKSKSNCQIEMVLNCSEIFTTRIKIGQLITGVGTVEQAVKIYRTNINKNNEHIQKLKEQQIVLLEIVQRCT